MRITLVKSWVAKTKNVAPPHSHNSCVLVLVMMMSLDFVVLLILILLDERNRKLSRRTTAFKDIPSLETRPLLALIASNY